MAKLKRCLLVAGLVLFLPSTAGPAKIEGLDEGWQADTNAHPVNGLLFEGGGVRGGGYNGGTPFYKGDDVWTTFTTTDGLASTWADTIAVDGDVRLWFGTHDGEVSMLDHGGTPLNGGGDIWATFAATDGLASDWVNAIAMDGARQLWFGTEDDVSIPDHGDTPTDRSDDTWVTFTESDGLAANQVCAIAVDSDGLLWFGTCDHTQPYGGVSVLEDGSTAFDKGDDIWATFTESDGLASPIVQAISVDGGGRLWFGTYDYYGSGLYSGVSVLDYSGTPFDKEDDTWATLTDGLPTTDVYATAVDDEDRLWFGTYFQFTGIWVGGVSVLDHGGTPFDKGDDTWASFTESDGLPVDQTCAIAVDDQGRFWFGTGCIHSGYGVSVLDHGGTPFEKGDDNWATFTNTDGLADNLVYTIALDGGGRLWFGTRDGVSVLDHGHTPFDKGDDTWTTFTTADGLSDNRVYSIAVDGIGRLWFGTCGMGVSRLDHRRTPFDKGDDIWTTFTTADGLADDCVNVIAADDKWRAMPGRRRLWFGTEGGVGELIYEAYDIYLPAVLTPWDARFEDNDNCLTAYGPLTCDQTYLAYPDDIDDYYYFEISERATINVIVEDFTPTSSYGDLLLYGPASGDECGRYVRHYGIPGHSSMSLGPLSLQLGRYHVRVYTVEGHYSTAQLYRLTVYCSAESAQANTPGASLQPLGR